MSGTGVLVRHSFFRQLEIGQWSTSRGNFANAVATIGREDGYAPCDTRAFERQTLHRTLQHYLRCQLAQFKQIADSSPTNAVSFSSARTTNAFRRHNARQRSGLFAF